MNDKSEVKNNGLMFGIIDGTAIGQKFESRKDLAKSGIHTPGMHGIWGREKEGSCSIVLSGGYEDDIDELDYILYTGQGGQDSPGGTQVADQEFLRGNKGLQLSCDYNLPIRVTRGHQVINGPDSGYRYDGLYYVTSYERVVGKSGFYICRFHLQSELTIKDLETKLEENLPQGYIAAERKETIINRLSRNIRLREKVKAMYEFRCQVCDILLKKPGGAIAIGAHIKGLGRPHNGPDVIENMLCLCPNHHDQFDALSFYIEPADLEVKGLDGFEGSKIRIQKRHNLAREFLEYHKQQFIDKNPRSHA
jgi:putative restriction endonuclease|tara:strand:+ start:315 stop:1235 length:921 start_codon:yes stop_codon:yes gene_type:complete